MEQLQAVVENRTGFCLDPRTKLLLMAVVATAEFLYSHTAFMIAVAMIPFVLLLMLVLMTVFSEQLHRKTAAKRAGNA